jgi:hypothetical protein
MRRTDVRSTPAGNIAREAPSNVMLVASAAMRGSRKRPAKPFTLSVLDHAMREAVDQATSEAEEGRTSTDVD